MWSKFEGQICRRGRHSWPWLGMVWMWEREAERRGAVARVPGLEQALLSWGKWVPCVASWVASLVLWCTSFSSFVPGWILNTQKNSLRERIFRAAPPVYDINITALVTPVSFPNV